jgi:hypothetical protein
MPAEVHLGATDLIAAKGEDLGVAAPAPVAPRHLVRDDHLLAYLMEPLEVKPLALACAWPATLEITRAVELGIDGA